MRDNGLIVTEDNMKVPLNLYVIQLAGYPLARSNNALKIKA
jgi:hypothetical protein